MFNCKTLDTWIDRSSNKLRQSDKTLLWIKKGNNVENINAGQKGVLVSQITDLENWKLITYQSNHPEIVDKVKELLDNIQGTGASVSLVAACGVMLANILTRAPEVLNEKFPDGSTFCASDTFMQHWLHENNVMVMKESNPCGTEETTELGRSV